MDNRHTINAPVSRQPEIDFRGMCNKNTKASCWNIIRHEEDWGKKAAFLKALQSVFPHYKDILFALYSAKVLSGKE